MSVFEINILGKQKSRIDLDSGYYRSSVSNFHSTKREEIMLRSLGVVTRPFNRR